MVDLNLITPPSIINLPEVFKERVNYTYNFARINLIDNNIDTLPFVVAAPGENVCKDIIYSFQLKNANGDVVEEGDDVAIYDYEKGEITFNKTGIITVIASSNSGSSKEATASYTFNINEGYNVYSYVQLQQVAKNANYDGQQINIVVLEKPVGETSYEYGYDLVSAAALKDKSNQTFDDIYKGNSQRINFVCKSVHINGNNHKIDLSQLRAMTPAELQDLASDPDTAEVTGIFATIAIIPWKAGEVEFDELKGRHFAKIYDLELIGNCGYSYGFDEEGNAISGTVVKNNVPHGVIDSGIIIGEKYQLTQYDIDLKNVKTAQFNYGMKFARVVSGTAEKIHVYDCYSNGINVANSIMNFKDVKFGKCGSGAIELIQPESDRAGLNFDQNQHITFDGYFDMSSNLHNGETNFFNNYKINNTYTIPQVLSGILAQYNDNQISHLKNADGKFGFVSFILCDMTPPYPSNSSEYEYPIYQNKGGIIKASELPTSGIDTTHQYIEVELDFTTTLGVHFGVALMYNHHYIPAN